MIVSFATKCDLQCMRSNNICRIPRIISDALAFLGVECDFVSEQENPDLRIVVPNNFRV